MRGLFFLLSFLLLSLLGPRPGSAQAITPIGVIQGTGPAATSGTYTIEGIVTAVYAGWAPVGFYVQNDAATADGDPATSDALYVVQLSPAVTAGDRVRITGSVAESTGAPSHGQAVLTAPVITPISSGNPLPPFALLDNSTFSTAAIERFEGMLIEFAAPVTVTDVQAVKSRGELTISPRGLVYQPTQVVDPNDANPAGTTTTGSSNVAAVHAYAASNATRTLLLDDGRASNSPSPTPYLDPVSRTVRVGSTLPTLRGILGSGSNRWRIQPLPGPDAPVVATVRPPVPAFSAIDVKLASFNVLNYFNGDGQGGGFPTSRGASTLADFQRQRAKIIVALSQIDADVVGLMEIENDGTGPGSALQDLVSGLNQVMGAGTYAFVNDGTNAQAFSTDVIRCAILYKPASVAPLGPPLIDPGNSFDRPAFAQLFTTHAPDTFGFVVNHFKSKASGSGLDADQGDGQGRSNYRRRLQAQDLVRFINTRVIPAGARRVVSVGDYNANYEEDPMDVLRAAGLVVPADPTSLSYTFGGLVGSLDHAVITPNLVGLADVRKWHINAFEPEFLQYDVARAATDITSPFRSADHDPVLIGISFSGLPMGTAAAQKGTQLDVFPNPAAGSIRFQLKGSHSDQAVSLEVLTALGQRVLALRGSVSQLQGELSQLTSALMPGIYWLRLRGAGFEQTRRVVKE